MFLKVFLRTFFNSIFVDNFIIGMFVKICNKKTGMSINGLKKKTNSPINSLERENIFFQSFTGDTLDCNN